MKIVSWNVNGIRAILSKKDFHEFVRKEKPDILCLQETKAHPDQVDHEFEDYEYHYWNSAKRKGYSGTAVFSKIKPLSISYGMGIKEHDDEGRVITLEFPHFYLVNVYTPNAQPGLVRLKYKQKWDADFLSFVKKLEKKKPVIFAGDLNVAHEEIDIARPKDNRMNPGFTDQERADFTEYMKHGFVDTFRASHPKEIKYSWWTYRFNARKKNIGWRIDYVVVSKELINKIKSAFILNEYHGSDHCPVGIELKY
jgi:exodeoxyribonuclease-3